MKRLLLMICLLSLLLTGCNLRQTPSNLSNNCYAAAIKVLDVTDDYLDNKITAVVAAGQIQDICRNLSSLPDEAGTQDQDVKSYCEVLSYTIMLVADGDYINEKEIIHTRNYLAKLLGEELKE